MSFDDSYPPVSPLSYPVGVQIYASWTDGITGSHTFNMSLQVNPVLNGFNPLDFSDESFQMILAGIQAAIENEADPADVTFSWSATATSLGFGGSDYS